MITIERDKQTMSALNVISLEGVTVAIPDTTAQRWEYFSPLLSGNWTEATNQVPFTLAQLQQWLTLDRMLEKKHYVLTPSDPLLSYSDVVEQADYFGGGDEWLEYVRVDETTPEEERREAYLRQGRYIRSQRHPPGYTILSYHARPVVHHNFFLSSDPIYNNKVPHRYYGDTDLSRWSTPITPEQRARALALDDISVLAGIVNSSWLINRREGEVAWQDIPWNDLIKFVPYPGILGGYQGDDREQAITRLESSKVVKRAYYEYALADVAPPIEPYVGYRTYVDVDSGQGLQAASIEFRPGWSSFDGKFRPDNLPFDDQFPSLRDVSEFYDKMSEAMRLSPYKSRVKHSKKTTTEQRAQADEVSRLHTRLLMCGLSPILPGGKIGDINKLEGGLLSVHSHKKTLLVTAEAVVPIITLTTLYRGQYLRFTMEHLLNDETIPEEHFPAVIEYYLKTLGAKSLNRSCEMLMEYYLALSDKDREEQARVLTFCELAHTTMSE